MSPTNINNKENIEQIKKWNNFVENSNLTKISSLDFVNQIQEAAKDKQKIEQVRLLIENDKSYLDFIQKLSLEEKSIVLETICDKSDYFKHNENEKWASFERRNIFKNKIFSTKEDGINRINTIIKNSKENDKWNFENKKLAIEKIERYFLVSEIIDSLWYDRQEVSINENLKKQVNFEIENDPEKKYFFWWMKSENRQIQRSILLRMLDMRNYDEKQNFFISQEKLDKIRENTWNKWVIFGLIKSLSALKQDDQQRINNLSDDSLKNFLEDCLQNENVFSKINNIESIYSSIDKNAQDQIALLLVAELNIRNYSDNLASWALKNDPNSPEAKKINKKIIDSEENIIEARLLFESEIKQKKPELFSNLSTQESKRKVEELWIDLLTVEKISYKEKSFTTLTEERKHQILSNQINADIRTFTKKQEKGFPDFNKKSTVEQITIGQNIANDISKSIANEIIEEPRRDEVKKWLDQVSKENDQRLFVKAVEYWFATELREARGDQYYNQIEQNYIQTYEIKYTTTNSKYQKSEVGNYIHREVFSDIQNINTLFGDLEISPQTIQWSLSKEEYKNNLSRIYKERPEIAIYNDVNQSIKDSFIDRITYFLAESLDINLDQDQKENILETIKFDKNNRMLPNNDKKEISLIGNYNNQKVKVFYDVVSWEIKISQRLDIVTDSQSVSVDEKIKTLPWIKWPKILSFFHQAQQIPYENIIKKSNILSGKDLQQEITNQLKVFSPFMDFSLKEEMKTELLRTITAQEVFEMIGVKNKQRSSSGINGKTDPLYPLLARSFAVYNQEELINIRNAIKDMIQFSQIQKRINKKETINISEKVEDLSKSIENKYYKSGKEIVNFLFSVKERYNSTSQYLGQQFTGFFYSFLSKWPRSKDGKKILDTQKFANFTKILKGYSDKLLNNDYYPILTENMRSVFANKELAYKLALNVNFNEIDGERNNKDADIYLEDKLKTERNW